MMKNNTLITATVNNDNIERYEVVTNVYSTASFFAMYLNNANDNYNVVVDSDELDSRACKDDYIHVYRHNTSQACAKAHNNVFQCYLKHSKNIVKVLCNKKNFEAFTSDTEHTKEYKNASLIRYIVSYDNFIDFMNELITYDNARATTSATKENAIQIAK